MNYLRFNKKDNKNFCENSPLPHQNQARPPCGGLASVGYIVVIVETHGRASLQGFYYLSCISFCKRSFSRGTILLKFTASFSGRREGRFLLLPPYFRINNIDVTIGVFQNIARQQIPNIIVLVFISPCSCLRKANC